MGSKACCFILRRSGMRRCYTLLELAGSDCGELSLRMQEVVSRSEVRTSSPLASPTPPSTHPETSQASLSAHTRMFERSGRDAISACSREDQGRSSSGSRLACAQLTRWAGRG